MLYEVQGEGTNQSAVRFSDRDGYGGARCQQRSTCSIKHGVVGAIAGAINVACIKQGLGGAAGTDRFGEKCLTGQVGR